MVSESTAKMTSKTIFPLQSCFGFNLTFRKYNTGSTMADKGIELKTCRSKVVYLSFYLSLHQSIIFPSSALKCLSCFGFSLQLFSSLDVRTLLLAVGFVNH